MTWRFNSPYKHDTRTIEKPPFYVNAAWGHERMLQYYQITTMSTFHVLYPIQLYNNIIGSKSPWNVSYSAWFADDCCHPNGDGHKWAALVVAYAIHLEHFKMQHYPNEVALLEFDSHGQLPPHWMTTPKDQKRFATLSQPPLTSYNFERDKWDSKWDSFIDRQGDWDLVADNKSHSGIPKWGLIATEPHSEMAIKVNVTKYITISYLRTYENIGSVAVWIDEESVDPMRKGSGSKGHCDVLNKRLIGDLINNSVAVNGSEFFALNGLSEERVSIAEQAVISVDVPPSNQRGKGDRQSLETRWVHICLQSQQRFKLLG